MADQLARGIFANFGPGEHPFQSPNGMEDNLRLIDDVLGLYTLRPPQAPGTALPESPTAGAGQIFTDGSFSVFNGGAWRTYAPRKGLRAVLQTGADAWDNSGQGWTQFSASIVAELEPLVEAAENARDASFALGPKYTTEALGRAAVADGAVFLVVGSGDVAAFEYRRVNSGSSTLIATYPSLAGLLTLRNELSEIAQVIGYPTLPVADGSANLDSSHYVFAEPVAADGLVSGFAYYGGGTAGTVKVRAYSKSGDSFSVVSEQVISTVAGAQSAQVGMKVSAGQYLGFAASASGVLRYGSGAPDSGGWYTAAGGYAGSTFDDASVSATLRLNVRFEVQTLTRVGTLEERVDTAEAAIAQRVTKDEVYNTIERKTVIGLDGVIAAGVGGLDNSLYALEEAAPVAAEITKFRCYATGAGSVRTMVFAKSGDTFTVVDEQTVSVVEGHNSVDVSLAIAAGQHMGSQGTVVGYQTGVSDTSGFYGGAGSSSFIDASVTRSTRLLIGFDLTYAEEVLKGGGRPTPADLPFENTLYLVTGQSLGEGSSTTSNPQTPITIEQEFDTLGFAAYNATPSAVYPATVANTQRTHPTLGPRGEWPGLGCAAAIRRALLRDNNLSYDAVKSTIVVANTASDGQRIGLLGPGSVPYEAGIAKAAALAGLVTGSAGVGAVLWVQGESDGPLFNNTDPAVYLAALKQIALDYDADLRAATGQTKRVPLITYQTCSTGRAIALAQLQAALESPLIYMACPMYQLDYYDALHINPASSRLLGAYLGEAAKETVIDGKKWEPLRPIDVQVLGSTITLNFNKSGLRFDTTLVPAQTNFGFSVKDGAGDPVTVSAVALRNSNQVRLTCASAPAANWLVQYGNLNAAGKPPFAGGAGNLRDSRGDYVTFDGQPLHNWCVLFDVVL